MTTYTFSEKELETYTKAVKQLAVIEVYFEKTQKLKRQVSGAERELKNAKELRNRFGMFEDCGESYREELSMAERSFYSLKSELKIAKKALKEARRSLKKYKEELNLNKNVENLIKDYTVDLPMIEKKHRKQISRFGGDFFLTVHAVVAHKKKYHMKPMNNEENEILNLFNKFKKTSTNKNFVRYTRVSIADNLDVLKSAISVYKKGELLFSKEQKAYLEKLLQSLEKHL